MLRLKRFLPVFITGVISLGLTSVSIIQQIQRHYQPAIRSVSEVTPAPTAMVLGASVKLDGTPSDALRDRVMVGIQLYKEGKVSNLLMTGDDGGFHANEVATMKRLAIEAGVPEKDILVDGHGYRTYESCKRAVQTFNIRQAIVVTQRFHLARALYLCSHLGMDAQGVAADLQPYERIVFFTLRDFAASLKAWWDINIDPPPSPVAY
ncbi:YdcF family protein [Patescibacteria group bacterium]|nr:YdcF family protein [Patescibacteria group bacterium]